MNHSYASTVFLIRLNYRPFFGQSSGFRSGKFIHTQLICQLINPPPKASLTRKFRGLFWIALSNFIIPLLLSLTSAIIYLVNKEKIIIILQINLANNYVSIIAVVFATLWASGSSWYKENIPDGTDVLSTFRIRHLSDGGQLPVFVRHRHRHRQDQGSGSGLGSETMKESEFMSTVQVTSLSGFGEELPSEALSLTSHDNNNNNNEKGSRLMGELPSVGTDKMMDHDGQSSGTLTVEA